MASLVVEIGFGPTHIPQAEILIKQECLWGTKPWRGGKLNLYKIPPGVYNLTRKIK